MALNHNKYHQETYNLFRASHITIENMKVGFVFHKNPCSSPVGIDIIRLNALTEGLIKRGMEVDIIAPVEMVSRTAAGVPVNPLSCLQGEDHYDVLKTCYHFSIELIGAFKGPVVSRIVRVVDEKLPERDMAWRERLMKCQELIRARSSVVVMNNLDNARRWRKLYGKPTSICMIPTGCPYVLPRKGKNPYGHDEKAILFLGSLASPRMVDMINDLAAGLKNIARLHHIGQSKTHLYGNGEAWKLSPLVVQHGEMCEDSVWNYIRHARAGLAIAAGPDSFDNDLSKIYNYLRGGLQVLSEERIVNNDLVRATRWGEVFRYGNMGDAVVKAAIILERRFQGRERSVMSYMAREHAWENRVNQYFTLFKSLQAEAQNTCPC